MNYELMIHENERLSLALIVYVTNGKIKKVLWILNLFFSNNLPLIYIAKKYFQSIYTVSYYWS